MGTAASNAGLAACLEEFITAWEQAYWNSYFSHLIGEVSPVNVNIVQLWQGLGNTGKKFPPEVLNPSGKTIKDLIV